MIPAYVPPNRSMDAFNCPHCGVYATQTYLRDVKVSRPNTIPADVKVEGVVVSECRKCSKQAIWKGDSLLYPGRSSAPMPAENMPENMLKDYEEARAVFDISPRSSAALLRVALQRLCIHLGQPGENLNQDIKSLVKSGLLPENQKALDIIRLVGNSAVHPGEIDFAEDGSTARPLFDILNVLVERLVSHPKRIDDIYETIPESKRQEIEKRDNK